MWDRRGGGGDRLGQQDGFHVRGMMDGQAVASYARMMRQALRQGSNQSSPPAASGECCLAMAFCPFASAPTLLDASMQLSLMLLLLPLLLLWL